MENQININDFVGVIGALAGVVLGGLITLLITHVQLRNQEKQRREEKKIKTYEAIHEHLSILDHEAGYAFLQSLGKIGHGMPIDTKKRSTLPWEKLEMLINFYTPELKEDIKIIRNKWDNLGRAFGLIVVEKYTQKEGATELLKQINEFSNQIENQVSIAKNKLAKLVNKIA